MGLLRRPGARGLLFSESSLGRQAQRALSRSHSCTHSSSVMVAIFCRSSVARLVRHETTPARGRHLHVRHRDVHCWLPERKLWHVYGRHLRQRCPTSPGKSSSIATWRTNTFPTCWAFLPAPGKSSSIATSSGGDHRGHGAWPTSPREVLFDRDVAERVALSSPGLFLNSDLRRVNCPRRWIILIPKRCKSRKVSPSYQPPGSPLRSRRGTPLKGYRPATVLPAPGKSSSITTSRPYQPPGSPLRSRRPGAPI